MRIHSLNIKLLLLMYLTILFVPSICYGRDNLFLSGFSSFSVSAFPQKPLYENQNNKMLNFHFTIQPKLIYELYNIDHRITIIPFIAFDDYDDERNHMDLREFNLSHVGNQLLFYQIGISKIFWGVTESRHLVDIINQTDLIENISFDEKLGQPMLNFGFDDNKWGVIEFFVLPFFRERTYPELKGRFRGPVLIDNDQSTYESKERNKHIDFSIRYNNSIGGLDLGFSHFYGTSREPQFKLSISKKGDSVLIPHYALINQTGIDLQLTIKEWLWKLETIYRSSQIYSFVAITGGLEYTIFSVSSTKYDLGLLIEYNFDDRCSNAPATLLNDDWFLGTRLALNNKDNTSILAGIITATQTLASSFKIDFTSLLSIHWKLNITIDGYLNTEDDAILNSIKKDNNVKVKFFYYF